MENPESSHAHPNFRRSGESRFASAPLWRLVLLLGAFALLRPLLHMTGVAGDDGPIHPGAAAVGATVLITAVWVAVVHVARAPNPFLTLVGAALAYAALSIVLSGILSPVLQGELQGPLGTPAGIPATLLTNAVWGAFAGGIATALRHLTSRE